MGLIKAGIQAVRGTLADQWVDYIRCDAMPETILMRPGKRVVGKGSSNVHGSDNIISDGSKIDIADGQCMLIVENGRIVDFCQEPGQYVYDSKTQPSLLGGGFDDLGESFKQVGKRFAAGGIATDTQKVYYVNLLEIHGNKIGVGNIPFRDSEFGFTVKVQGFGTYSYRIKNPLLFYTNLAGNTDGIYERKTIETQLKNELSMSLQPALGKIASMGISYDQLINYPKEIGMALNKELTEDWEKRRGIVIESVAFASLTVDDESADKIAKFQEARVFTNPDMLRSQMGLSQSEAFANMGKNPGGANPSDMMGMAMGAMSMNMMSGMGGVMQTPTGGTQVPTCPTPTPPVVPVVNKPAEAPGGTEATWTCGCGKVNTGKFCADCGKPKPAQDHWSCPSCGAANMGRFCSECGSKKPVGEPQYKCDKCGWMPPDPKNPPKFCPECGDPFGDEDVVG